MHINTFKELYAIANPETAKYIVSKTEYETARTKYEDDIKEWKYQQDVATAIVRAVNTITQALAIDLGLPKYRLDLSERPTPPVKPDRPIPYSSYYFNETIKTQDQWTKAKIKHMDSSIINNTQSRASGFIKPSSDSAQGV